VVPVRFPLVVKVNGIRVKQEFPNGQIGGRFVRRNQKFLVDGQRGLVADLPRQTGFYPTQNWIFNENKQCLVVRHVGIQENDEQAMLENSTRRHFPLSISHL
jgi:hypothetical protein